MSTPPPPSLPLPIPVEEITLLCRDLAEGFQEADVILAKYRLGHPDTDPVTAQLFGTQGFQKLYDGVQSELGAATGTVQRTRVKAGLLVESSLPAVHALVQDPAVEPRTRIEAFRSLSKVSGVENHPQAEAQHEKFIINISVPGQSVPLLDLTVEMPPNPQPLPPRGEGEQEEPLVQFPEEGLGGEEDLMSWLNSGLD